MNPENRQGSRRSRARAGVGPDRSGDAAALAATLPVGPSSVVESPIMAHRVTALVLTLALALTSGCARPLDSLRADPTLTFREVQRGRVALLPVAARAADVTLEELTLLDEILRAAFDERARGLKRVPDARVVRAIGTDFTSWDTVVRFANTGEADARALSHLGESLGARYLVFTSVDYEEIGSPLSDFERAWSYQSGQSPWPRGSGDWKVFGRKNRYQGAARTTSQIVATVTVMDVETGQARWEGKHRVARAVGNTVHAPKPSRVAWPLFSQMAAALPHEE
jgi:hypothetical protein